jgi:hypothetical protein
LSTLLKSISWDSPFNPIRKSLNLSSTSGNVELIYNGVSDRHETLYPYLKNANNEGEMELFTKEDLGNRKVGR